MICWMRASTPCADNNRPRRQWWGPDARKTAVSTTAVREGRCCYCGGGACLRRHKQRESAKKRVSQTIIPRHVERGWRHIVNRRRQGRTALGTFPYASGGQFYPSKGVYFYFFLLSFSFLHAIVFGRMRYSRIQQNPSVSNTNNWPV